MGTKNILSLALFLWLCSFPVQAQNNEAQNEVQNEAQEEIIVLPEVEINEQKEQVNTVSQEQMEREGSTDLWEALRNVPGVIRSAGTDDESSFKIRGFAPSLMPAYIDDVPVTSPYWGNADYARILSGDLESVEIQKGYSSMLLGANTMGGAVIMRTAKPKKPFEASYRTMIDLDSVGKYSSSLNVVSFGTKQNLFYGGAMLQYRVLDHFRLSGDFEPDDRNPQQEGKRLNSDSNDLKLTFLSGWTPNDNFTLNLKFVHQNADKDDTPPPVTGPVFRTDSWPEWKRSVVSLDGTYTSDALSGKALFYFDKFDTTLTQKNGVLEKTTENDDYSLGFRLAVGYDLNAWNTLSAAFNFKRESHTGLDDGTETMDIIEHIFSGGAEYTLKLFKVITLGAGFGLDFLQPAQFTNSKNLRKTMPRYMLSWQAGIFYAITPNHEARFTYAKKNHIPSMGQRYEEIRQDALPNPDLKNEIAYHYEVGYKGLFSCVINDIFKPSITIDTAVYYANLVDMIAEEYVTTSTGGRTKIRLNIGETDYYGFEAGLELYLCKYFSAGGTAALNRYKIKSDPDGFAGEQNFPRSAYSAYMTINPFAAFNVTALETLALTGIFEYEGPRYSRPEGASVLNVGSTLDRYTLMHIKVSLDINEYFSLSTGIENLLDENYALDDELYPLPGRTFTLTFTAKY
jgi:iron complex outermembrane receptor protein